MAIEKIHLSKVLKLIALPENKLTSALRRDIRDEIKKETEDDNEGGDFYVPFWADAKSYVIENTNLQDKTIERIEKNKNRKVLYEALCTSFLSWWNEKRRWTNQDYKSLPFSISNQLPITELGITVKMENFLALTMDDETHKIIYPYFAKEPRLDKQIARIGLWVLTKSFHEFKSEEFRILDVLQGRSFTIEDCPFEGNEEYLLIENCKQVLKMYETLKTEY